MFEDICLCSGGRLIDNTGVNVLNPECKNCHRYKLHIAVQSQHPLMLTYFQDPPIEENEKGECFCKYKIVI